MARLRLAFLGSDAIALPLLDWLVGPGTSQVEMVGVFSQPDRAVGRGQQVVPNGIVTWARARSLPVFQPAKLTDESREDLARLNPDVALVMAYGHILRGPFIATPRLGTLNLHASILPRYRGASPIQAAIAAGERETGVSLMRIVLRLDAGPVADLERVPIAPLDTAVEVEAKLAAACVPLVARNLAGLPDGSLNFAPQDETAATYCRRLEKDDGALDFNAPAAVLAARINALHPWPGCSVELAGARIRIGQADSIQPMGERPREAGTVLGADAEGLLVAVHEGVLRLRRLQRPGGRMLPAADFLRGFPLPDGARLPSRRMPAFVASEPFR